MVGGPASNTLTVCRTMPSRRPLLSKPWTAEDDARLLKLLRQGKHLTVIAALLRRTPSAVRTRIGKERRASRPESEGGTRSSGQR
jgi:hypothetical protein